LSHPRRLFGSARSSAGEGRLSPRQRRGPGGDRDPLSLTQPACRRAGAGRRRPHVHRYPRRGCLMANVPPPVRRGKGEPPPQLALDILAQAPDVDALNVLGAIELGRGRRAAARAYFARALILAPFAAPPTLNLALIFHAEGQLERAGLWSRRARHLDPALVDA